MPLGRMPKSRAGVDVPDMGVGGDIDPDHAEYSREDVLNWMTECFTNGCFPIFRTRFAGVRLSNNTMLGVCMGCAGFVRSRAWGGVPDDLLDLIEGPGVGWRAVIEYLGESPEMYLARVLPR